MRIERRCFCGIVVPLVCLVIAAGVAYAAHPTVRWDFGFLDTTTTPPTFKAGGTSSARAEDGSKITLTGSGTFRLKPGNPQATGGGTWTTFGPSGSPTATGTYQATGVVRFEVAPGTFPGGVTDGIGNAAEARGGLAVLTIEYSDGDEGILVVPCGLEGSPPTLFDSITATKGFVDFWNHAIELVTVFHVSP